MHRKAFCVFRSVFVFVILLVGQAAAQEWTQHRPNGMPPALGFHGPTAVYAPASNRMIVFGGREGCNYNNTNDVWVLTNANGLGGTGQWLRLNTNGTRPLVRSGHSAVYDPTTNRMTIFGGCNGYCTPVMNDVWVLSNADGLGGTPTWTQLSPVGNPPDARTRPTAAYDPTTNRMIVFAGQDGGGGEFQRFFPDVWVLTNANGLGGVPTWTQLATSGGPPPGQYGPSAVYDPDSNRLIAFGGNAVRIGSSNAVWVLTNANGLGGSPVWVNLIAEGADGSPSPNAFHSAVYNTATNQMIIFGGYYPSYPLNDVWVLSNANGLGDDPFWAQLAPSGRRMPVGRASHTAVIDDTTNRMIIFGGDDDEAYFNTTWVLANATGG
jgi:hypothetical protein